MGSLVRSFSSLMKQGDDRSNNNDGGGSELVLNVYDLTPMNSYGYWFGVGVFHSGIEVHGMEYGFGAHEYPASGVFEEEPRRCPGFIYRCSVWLGTTKMSLFEFQDFIENLSMKYHGNSYNLISKNCNHFTNDVCMHLTGKPIPGWVNRLARLGSFCNCLLPEIIQVTTVRAPEHAALSDGSESLSSDSGDDDDDEDMAHHLLTTTTRCPALSKAKHVTISGGSLLIPFYITLLTVYSGLTKTENRKQPACQGLPRVFGLLSVE